MYISLKKGTKSIIIKKAIIYLKNKTPFDERFDPNDSTAFSCSELPIHIIKSSYGIDISNRSAKPRFSIFLNKEYFNEIEFIVKRTKFPEQKIIFTTPKQL